MYTFQPTARVRVLREQQNDYAGQEGEREYLREREREKSRVVFNDPNANPMWKPVILFLSTVQWINNLEFIPRNYHQNE